MDKKIKHIDCPIPPFRSEGFLDKPVGSKLCVPLRLVAARHPTDIVQAAFERAWALWLFTGTTLKEEDWKTELAVSSDDKDRRYRALDKEFVGRIAEELKELAKDPAGKGADDIGRMYMYAAADQRDYLREAVDEY